MKIKLSDSYFVFDLDDTIYNEIDYKISGINYLVKQISQIYGLSLESSSFYNVDNFIQEIQAQLGTENFDYMLINHRFFLVEGNADLFEGRTAQLQQRFNELLKLNVLTPVEQQGSVVLYKINL